MGSGTALSLVRSEDFLEAWKTHLEEGRLGVSCPGNTGQCSPTCFIQPLGLSGTDREPRVFVPKENVRRPGKWTSQKPGATPVCQTRKN